MGPDTRDGVMGAEAWDAMADVLTIFCGGFLMPRRA